MMLSIRNILTHFLLVYPLTWLGRVDCELYTSVEELSHWPDITRQFSNVLNELIIFEESRLHKLKRVQESLSEALKIQLESSKLGPDTLTPTSGNRMSNPINAFITINRLNRAIDDVHELLDEELTFGESSDKDNELKGETHSYTSRLKNIFLKIKHHLPVNDDLVGSAEALLRLQSFYNIQIDDITKGVLPKIFIWSVDDQKNVSRKRNEEGRSNDIKESYRIMKAVDCFELGRTAFQNGHYPLAIQWLHKGLEFASNNTQQEQDEENYDLINDILEYMAFSAYKIGQIDYSAKLTQAWLERDPQNDRALENLEYYREELDQQQQQNDLTTTDTELTNSSMSNEARSQSYSDVQAITNLDSYSVADDEIVRNLCQSSSAVSVSPNLKCYRQLQPDYYYTRIELLSDDPKIIRVYDIISDSEANYLRHEALPRLERSTVHSGSGFKPSDFRIAKTAWVSSKSDAIVERIERRLTSVLGLSMENSEALQVVNYGLGGFYGPHLDSARSTGLRANNSALIDELGRSDRLATILIYLNHVEAGGSTVFPRLDVSVRPIERSAVVWLNINEEGYSDERTLHTGCPVLLGSKWIATKWPREAANTFKIRSLFKR